MYFLFFYDCFMILFYDFLMIFFVFPLVFMFFNDFFNDSLKMIFLNGNFMIFL